MAFSRLFPALFSLLTLLSAHAAALNITAVDGYGPTVVRSLQALSYSVPSPETMGNELLVPISQTGHAIVRRDSLNSLYIAFQDSAGDTSTWASSSAQVPFLRNARHSHAPL